MAGQEPDVGLASLSSNTADNTANNAADNTADNTANSTANSTAPTTPNDEAWFRELFADAYRPLVAYTRRRTSDWSEADDIVSEVFAIAWRRRDERNVDRSPLPWLYGIAANVARNHWRAGSRRLRLVDRLEAQPPRREIEDPAERSASSLRHALGQLSDDDQEVLRLVAWEGLAHAEVAEILDCSTNAIGIRLHRARQRLQQQLDQHQATSDTANHQPTSEEETS